MPAEPKSVRRIDWASTDAYHAAPGWSRSQMVDVLPPEGSPGLFERRHVRNVDAKRDTDALKIGRLVHDAQLCRQGPLKNVRIVPKKVLTRNGHRRGPAWEAFRAEHPDSLLVNDRELALLKGIARAIRESAPARRMLERCEKEVGIHWTEIVDLPTVDEATGRVTPDDVRAFLPLKDQIDGVADDVICELKTAERIDSRSVSQEVYSRHYDLQARLHQYAVELLTGKKLPVVIIAVTKGPDFEAAVHHLHAEDDRENPLAIGEDKLRECLAVLARGTVTGKWRQPGHGRTLLCPAPAYARFRSQWRVE